MRTRTVVTAISRIAERPAPREACVVVIYGAQLGRKYPIDNDTVTLGRSSRATIQIDEDCVSRLHAELSYKGKEVVLRDLGSTNGTYVNDEVVRERTLADGDLVKIGRTLFKFLSSDNIEHAYHEEIYKLTTVDGLTQVYNKRYFLETLDREVSRAQRHRRPLSMLLLDLDHFKNVNDTYGHLAGDALLKQFAQLVHQRVRREDLVARYGGEEFAILLPESDRAVAIELAEKLRRLIERATFMFEDTAIPITVSIGAAELVAGLDPQEFLRMSDVQLYKAKSGGRNRVSG